MSEFIVSGPHVVPVYKGKVGRIVRAEEGEEFFRNHPSLQGRSGCYVFAMRASRGLTPMYVGKATKSFGQECFASHKLGKCNEILADYARGTLVLFMFESPSGRKAPTYQIDLLENFLIQSALSVNDTLLNIKKTKQETWSIRGMIRSSKKGKRSKAASAASNMLGLD
ncbi:hypothetical protein HIV01_004235 [Lysobacter arenosi]|uniref:Uncharacterized protein n=1 Tax=Lysobacter arenosi TaxID=2795387 RepID=A0ABX7RC50_9GAMM|nr:hypothetical protein [Lysobacter arenosi]QSX75740.1 hypothetical protein HIV01_004235 [Lysobacter arenosi]